MIIKERPLANKERKGSCENRLKLIIERGLGNNQVIVELYLL
jgi:hypothetical protein